MALWTNMLGVRISALLLLAVAVFGQGAGSGDVLDDRVGVLRVALTQQGSAVEQISVQNRTMGRLLVTAEITAPGAVPVRKIVTLKSEASALLGTFPAAAPARVRLAEVLELDAGAAPAPAEVAPARAEPVPVPRMTDEPENYIQPPDASARMNVGGVKERAVRTWEELRGGLERLKPNSPEEKRRLLVDGLPAYFTKQFVASLCPSLIGALLLQLAIWIVCRGRISFPQAWTCLVLMILLGSMARIVCTYTGVLLDKSFSLTLLVGHILSFVTFTGVGIAYVAKVALRTDGSPIGVPRALGSMLVYFLIPTFIAVMAGFFLHVAGLF